MACLFAREVGKEICKIFNLNPAVTRSININFEVDDIVILTTEQYPTDSQISDVVKVLTKYELVKKEEPDGKN